MQRTGCQYQNYQRSNLVEIGNAFNKYDLAEDMGYRIQRFEPHAIESGGVIRWIKSQLERIEDGTNQTISTDGSNRSG